jgi:hypothetical protein
LRNSRRDFKRWTATEKGEMALVLSEKGAAPASDQIVTITRSVMIRMRKWVFLVVIVSMFASAPYFGPALGEMKSPMKEGKLWPSSPIRPEIAAQRAEAKAAMQGIEKGRLSKPQRRQLVLDHPSPRIREKARLAERSLQDLPRPRPTTSYSVTLSPNVRSTQDPDAYLNYYGVSVIGSSFFLQNLPIVSAVGTTVAVPQASVQLNDLPSTGWYLIDFYGTGNPTATLYTWEDADITQVESWDMTSSPTAYNHFVTAEYLEAGFHYFVFTVDTAHLYFHEVTIEAF